MVDTKPWYLSRSMWAGAVALAANLARQFGVEVPEGFEEELVTAILQALELGGVVLSIYFRAIAKKKVTL